MSDNPIPDGYVLAEWLGTSPVVVPATGTRLQPGDTYIVKESEAEESSHWRPTSKPKAHAKATPQTGEEE